MYIDEGPSAPLSAIGRAMDDFAGNAASGRFSLNERGGESLLAAIRNMAEWVDSQQFGFDLLLQSPKLGSSNNAEVMKPFLQLVAGDEQGFVTQLKQFRESLVKAEEGIKQAMANYRATDDSNATKY
ncbi:hypothetical protein [Actinokineospora cianjurensis]|uniref:Uncharacterized protein n=1 Tax=Actinokineospora cianjurensis TaxID=585224 RepID=A0A421B8A0_9PSEU|nr:hypothetical protein [Actinokineospora cianjurensis]RLK60485.1 hypothetical protein CLV68_0990 [Actinokineospora cianjurensis]